MKTKTSRKSKALGSSLLTVLFIGTMLSLGALSYLTLVDQQSYLSYRSQAWNLAMTLVEAGLEDGLEQLNSNSASLGTAPWSYDTNSSTYSHTYTSSAGSYTVYIQYYDPFNPLVRCKATVSEPTLVQYSPNAFFAAGGVNVNTPSTSGNSVARAVQIRATRSNLLIKGIVAKQNVNMNGNDISTDSFDSSDPAHSNNGMYPTNDWTKLKNNGDVAVNASVTNAVSAGNANIYGHVMVGAGGTVSVGPNGGVGDHAWQAAHPGAMEGGYVTDNANFTFPDQVYPYSASTAGVQLLSSGGSVSTTNYTLATNSTTTATYPNPVPYGGVVTNSVTVHTQTWPNQPNTITNCDNSQNKAKNQPAAGTYCINPPPWQTGGGTNNSSDWYWYGIKDYQYVSNSYTYNLYTTNYTVSTANYDYVLYSGDYYLGSALSGKILVLGNARLVVPNGINMSGNDTLTIAQTGSLQVYAGKTMNIDGNGVVNNNGFAQNCEIFCTPSVTSVSFTGNGEFTGVVVAPEANVTLKGGGHSNNDFSGALMANSVTLTGHYSFHYDEALSKNAAKARYIVKSWDEVNPDSF
jgi:hypothetical protein